MRVVLLFFFPLLSAGDGILKGLPLQTGTVKMMLVPTVTLQDADALHCVTHGWTRKQEFAFIYVGCVVI